LKKEQQEQSKAALEDQIKSLEEKLAKETDKIDQFKIQTLILDAKLTEMKDQAATQSIKFETQSNELARQIIALNQNYDNQKSFYEQQLQKVRMKFEAHLFEITSQIQMQSKTRAGQEKSASV